MSVTITANAQDNNSTWPFVTVPYFEEQGDQLLKVTGVKYSSFCPLVSANKRDAWEDWSKNNQGWISSELRLTKKNVNSTPQITPFIYVKDNTGGTVPAKNITSDKYYGPIWQIAPLLPYWVNCDLLNSDSMYEVFEGTLRTKNISR